jgi:transposase-like protein
MGCGDNYIAIKKIQGKHYFNCTKCKQRRGLRKGSWLESTHLSFVQIVDFLYFWCLGSQHSVIRAETGTSSHGTTTIWARKCRQVCEDALLREDCGVIGGYNIVVEIDESKFTKRKHNRGRLPSEGWVFGATERETGRCFFEFVPNRTEETLLEIISRRIRPGSIINSDLWAAYRKIPSIGYFHYTVNHSKNFIDPMTGAHTQSIESAWSHLKRFLQRMGRNIGPERSDYIAEYLYRKKHKADLFLTLLRDIAAIHTQ